MDVELEGNEGFDLPGGGERNRDLDLLLVPVLVLCSLGLIMAVSIRGVEEGMTPVLAIKNQGGRLAAALCGFLVCAILPLHVVRRWTGWAVAVGILACLATHLTSGAAKGASRWIEFGSFRFQPVEFARFALVIYGAHCLSMPRPEPGTPLWLRPRLRFAVATAALCLALLLQPDHGNTLFTAAVAGLMGLVAGIPLWTLGVVGCVGALGIAVKGMGHGYAMQRIRDFLDVEVGSQVGQGLVAMASGGVFGRGLGEGWMKMGFVSEARNDFVFTIIGEELGFAGTSIVVLAYTAIGWIGYRLVRQVQDPFLALVALGLVLVICLQAGINMLVNVGMAPAKGIDLPFVSSGGTSLVFCLAAVGVIGNAVRTDCRERE